MNLRLQSLFAGLLALLTAALLALAPAHGKPASGGYQLFEPVALEHQHAIQLAALENFNYHAKIASECCNAPNRTEDDILGPQARVDGEAGVSTSVPRFDGTPTPHEARLGREIADQGNDVRIRGDNVAGPDAQINGNWYDIKELTGTSPRSLQRSVGSARNNFSNDGAAELGLSRSDTRALVDARGNATWDNPAAVRAEFDRLSRNGDFNNVAEVRVITSNGVEIWTRP